MSSPRRSRKREERAAGGEERALFWTQRAQRDLEAIEDFIGASNPAAAERWVEKLMARALEVAASPLSGRVVPELGIVSIREVLLRNYRIVYRVQEEQVHVLTVFEGHRLLPTDAVTESDDD